MMMKPENKKTHTMMRCGSLFFRTTACKNINVLLLLLLRHIIPLLLRKGGTHNFRRPQKRTEMKVVAPYRVRKPSWLFSVLLPLKDLARSSCRLSNYYKSNFFESKHSNREEAKFKEHLCTYETWHCCWRRQSNSMVQILSYFAYKWAQMRRHHRWENNHQETHPDT